MSQIDGNIVRFSGLKSGAYTFDTTLDDTVLCGFQNEEIKGGNVHFDIKMERNERMIMFTFAFEGEVKTECDRCLGDMTVKVEGEEHLNVRFSDEETTDEEDTVILPETANEIDLTPWLYEYVAVRVPIQHTHPEGECDPEMVKFIVEEEQQRTDDYVDPRWEALKDLK